MKIPTVSVAVFSYRVALVIIVTILIGGGSYSRLMAQSSGDGDGGYLLNRHDPDFPGRRNLNAGVLATFSTHAPPPAVIGDMTYGINARLSVGVLAGTTGAQSLAGLKFSSVVYQRQNFRVMYRMVLVYYPGRDGEYLFDTTDKYIMPWMLSVATFDAEWRARGGIRWSAGMGALETHCIEGMKRYFWGASDERKVSPFDVFHTFQGSATVPLPGRLTLRPEVIVVMRNARLIRTGDFKVFPINPFIKLIYSF